MFVSLYCRLDKARLFFYMECCEAAPFSMAPFYPIYGGGFCYERNLFMFQLKINSNKKIINYLVE